MLLGTPGRSRRTGCRVGKVHCRIRAGEVDLFAGHARLVGPVQDCAFFLKGTRLIPHHHVVLSRPGLADIERPLEQDLCTARVAGCKGMVDVVPDLVPGRRVRVQHRDRGIFKKCVNSQAVYPLSEQHGLEAQDEEIDRP